MVNFLAMALIAMELYRRFVPDLIRFLIIVAMATFLTSLIVSCHAP